MHEIAWNFAFKLKMNFSELFISRNMEIILLKQADISNYDVTAF